MKTTLKLATLMICATGCGEGKRETQTQAKLDESRIEILNFSSNNEAAQPGDKEPIRALDTSDSNFCEGLTPGQCMTFVVRVPSPNLEKNAGLSTLSLMLRTDMGRAMLQEACDEGLQLSMATMNEQNGLLGELFWNVKKSRCVFKEINKEGEAMPAYAPNEMALAVRLVDFGVENNSTNIDPAAGTFTFANSKLSTKFRDVRVGSRDGASGAWLPVPGKRPLFGKYDGVFNTTGFRIAFAKNVSFHMNGARTLAYVGHVLTPILDAAKDTDRTKPLVPQLDLIKNALKMISSGSNPVAGGLVLIGLGVDAVRDICTFQDSSCIPQHSSEDIATQLRSTFGEEGAIPSETKAAFVDALKHLPMATLRATISGADGDRLSKLFHVPLPYDEEESETEL